MWAKMLNASGVLGLCVVALVMWNYPARAQEGCPAGSYSVVEAPDSSALTVLFDQFIVNAADSRRHCSLTIPLHLPEGFSLGVYRVDYRGFAHLAARQEADLTVVHFLGSDRKGHVFHRKVKGTKNEDFIFTENIGAGLMKRVGCGEAAVLNLAVDLSIEGGQGNEALAALDSADGAAKGGVIYYLDLKKCPTST